MAARALIVNADDFGRSAGINRGVATAHEHGIVTSASLMVRWPAAEEAAVYAREHPVLSVGLHFDLGEWIYHEDNWVQVDRVDSVDDAQAVIAQVAHQLAAFRRLVGRDPTHLDSHQHVHQHEPVRSALVRVARHLGVPLRHESPEVRYCGDFYGQAADGTPLPGALTVTNLIRILSGLPAGATELACHPGDGDDLESGYQAERAEEVKVLCDPLIRAEIIARGIELRSFADLARC